MNRTICVIHGVGFEDDLTGMDGFVSSLRSITGDKYRTFVWSHPGAVIDDPRSSWFFPAFRDWMHEVIMDFTHIVQNMGVLAASLPEADAYIGHSAGGVIAACNAYGKPAAVMGCPLQLIKNVHIKTVQANMLNIMHYRDPVAAPVDNADNRIIYSPLFTSWINPFAAHSSYWHNNTAIHYVSDWLGGIACPR